MNNHEEISLMEPRQVGFPMTKAMRVTCSNGHLFLALDDHPKGAGDYHCPHCDQGRIAAAVSASNRLQDQRDQVAAQLKDATHQCGVQADLLREAKRYVKYHLEHSECDARIVMGLFSDIEDALTGKYQTSTVSEGVAQ